MKIFVTAIFDRSEFVFKLRDSNQKIVRLNITGNRHPSPFSMLKIAPSAAPWSMPAAKSGTSRCPATIIHDRHNEEEEANQPIWQKLLSRILLSGLSLNGRGRTQSDLEEFRQMFIINLWRWLF
jgi:hypothetical protein